MSDKNYKSLQEAYNSIYEQQYTVFGGNRYLVKPDGTLTYPTDGRTTPTPDELKVASTAPKLKPVQTTTTATTTQTSPKPTTTSSQTVAAAGGKGGTVTVGKQYPATLGGKSVNVSYDASGKRTVTPVTSQPSTTTASPSSTSSTATPPAAPQKSFQQELDDLRKASAQATMAGPSKEAQALMSTRAKRLLGPDKLRAGIEGQERVQRMMSGTPEPTSTPKPTAPTSTTTTSSPTSKLEIKPGDFGTTMGPGPTFRGGPVPPPIPIINRNAIRQTDWTKIPEEVNIYDQVLEILLDEGYSVQESNRIMVELVNEAAWNDFIRAVQSRTGIGKPGVTAGQVARNVLRAGVSDILGTSIGAGSAPSASAPVKAPNVRAQTPTPIIRTSTQTIRTSPRGSNISPDPWRGGTTGNRIQDITKPSSTKPTTSTRALTGSSGTNVRGALPPSSSSARGGAITRATPGGAITPTAKPGAITPTTKPLTGKQVSTRIQPVTVRELPSSTRLSGSNPRGLLPQGVRNILPDPWRQVSDTVSGARNLWGRVQQAVKPQSQLRPSQTNVRGLLPAARPTAATQAAKPATSVRSQQFQDVQRLNRMTGGGLMGELPSTKPASKPAPKPTSVDKLAPKPSTSTKPSVKPQMPGGGSNILQGLGTLASLRNLTPLGIAAAVMAPRPVADGTLTAARARGDLNKGVPNDPMPTPEILRRAGVSPKPAAKPAAAKPAVKPAAAKPAVKPAAAKPAVKPAAKPIDPELQKYERLRVSDPAKAKELGTKIWLRRYGAPTEGDIG